MQSPSSSRLVIRLTGSVLHHIIASATDLVPALPTPQGSDCRLIIVGRAFASIVATVTKELWNEYLKALDLAKT
ncbi:hypothetical protein FA13DRAFT_1801408 [Coprinellus micaceus]|uniref:Uncharacterized protein n=1 Tax=Coprinellus micaceus TaxID=71717 RepID=A0A4Y7SG11_COPMI|nr:hypothetical protein FA13DRAFT_1801408 [Coprinellus micaceus]